MNSFPSSDFFSSIDTTRRNIYCEFCGLRYQSSRALANHQAEFCTGKTKKSSSDLSTNEDNKSVLFNSIYSSRVCVEIFLFTYTHL